MNSKEQQELLQTKRMEFIIGQEMSWNRSQSRSRNEGVGVAEVLAFKLKMHVKPSAAHTNHSFSAHFAIFDARISEAGLAGGAFTLYDMAPPPGRTLPRLLPPDPRLAHEVSN